MTFLTRFFSLAALGLVAFVPLGVAPVHAQSFPQLHTVQWGGGGGGGTQQAAENALRLNQMEEQLRQMTGRNEELIFRIQRLEDQLKRLQEDIDFRLQDLEGSSGGGNKNAPPQRRSETAPPSNAGNQQAANPNIGQNSAANQGSAAPGPQNLGDLVGQSSGAIMNDGRSGAPTPLSPQGNSNTQVAAIQGASAADDYAMGVGFLQRREYDYAEAQFTQFLQQYPQDANVPNALYGLGESYFYRKRYEDALENYLKVVQQHGSSPKAPESMLRLGVTLVAMNEKPQGCAALAEVSRKYPNANSVKSLAGREAKRLGC